MSEQLSLYKKSFFILPINRNGDLPSEHGKVRSVVAELMHKGDLLCILLELSSPPLQCPACVQGTATARPFGKRLLPVVPGQECSSVPNPD
jgi:hypothetical protein